MDKQELSIDEHDKVGIKIKDDCVCEVISDTMTYEEDIQLAQDIVTRFNSQPALVEDKKKLVEALEKIAHGTMSMYMSQGKMADDFKKIAIDALSAIEGA